MHRPSAFGGLSYVPGSAKILRMCIVWQWVFRLPRRHLCATVSPFSFPRPRTPANVNSRIALDDQGTHSNRRPSSAIHRPNHSVPRMRAIVHVFGRRPRVLRGQRVHRTETMPIVPAGAQSGARRRRGRGRGIWFASAALSRRLRGMWHRHRGALPAERRSPGLLPRLLQQALAIEKTRPRVGGTNLPLGGSNTASSSDCPLLVSARRPIRAPACRRSFSLRRLQDTRKESAFPRRHRLLTGAPEDL